MKWHNLRLTCWINRLTIQIKEGVWRWNRHTLERSQEEEETQEE